MAKYFIALCVVAFLVFEASSTYIRSSRSQGDCVDNHPDGGCVEWAEAGDCKQDSAYYEDMRKYCKLSCGFCKPGKREVGPIYGDEPMRRRQPEQTCRDLRPGNTCHKWAKDGSCRPEHTWHKYMMKYCKASCNPECNEDVKQKKRELVLSSLFTRETAELMSDGVQEACLKAHNDYRAIHSDPPLSWNSGLAKGSEKYALELANLNKFEHSKTGGKYGENLYYIGTYDDEMVDVESMCKLSVEAWYDEIKDYDFYHPGFSGATGHFTQVVWKSTRSVGMGLAKIKRSGGLTYIYAVARYDPPGNYMGQFKDNVLPAN